MIRTRLIALALTIAAATAGVVAGCTTLSASTTAVPAAAIAPGIYRVRTTMKCSDIDGDYSLNTNYGGGCTAMVDLGPCIAAPGGLCDCLGYPDNGGAGNGCDGINGGGISQDVEWR